MKIEQKQTKGTTNKLMETQFMQNFVMGVVLIFFLLIVLGLGIFIVFIFNAFLGIYNLQYSCDITQIITKK